MEQAGLNTVLYNVRNNSIDRDFRYIIAFLLIYLGAQLEMLHVNKKGYFIAILNFSLLINMSAILFSGLHKNIYSYHS